MNVNFEAIEKAWFKPKKDALYKLEEWCKSRLKKLDAETVPKEIKYEVIRLNTEYLKMIDKIQELKKEMK